MADVEMADAPAGSKGETAGKAIEGKKKFEVKKVRRDRLVCSAPDLANDTSGTPSHSGPGISLSTTAQFAETTSWTSVRTYTTVD